MKLETHEKIASWVTRICAGIALILFLLTITNLLGAL